VPEQNTLKEYEVATDIVTGTIYDSLALPVVATTPPKLNTDLVCPAKEQLMDPAFALTFIEIVPTRI